GLATGRRDPQLQQDPRRGLPPRPAPGGRDGRRQDGHPRGAQEEAEGAGQPDDRRGARRLPPRCKRAAERIVPSPCSLPTIREARREVTVTQKLLLLVGASAVAAIAVVMLGESSIADPDVWGM